MSPNTDNATSRLLLAIIRQKDLRDIDWNAVAKDPVLLQPITNGHAARMRLARFRAAVEGKDGTKKPRTSENGKIQKPGKKCTKPRKDTIKTETHASISTYAQYSPVSMNSPYVGDNSPYVDDTNQFDARYLTPSSDASTSRIPITTQGVEFLSHEGQQQLGMHPHSPSFSAFDAALDMTSYRMASNMQVDALGDFGDDWVTRTNLF